MTPISYWAFGLAALALGLNIFWSVREKHNMSARTFSLLWVLCLSIFVGSSTTGLYASNWLELDTQAEVVDETEGDGGCLDQKAFLGKCTHLEHELHVFENDFAANDWYCTCTGEKD